MLELMLVFIRKIMKKYFVSLALVFAAVIALAVPVFAQEDAQQDAEPSMGQTESAPAQTIEERQAKRRERITSTLTRKESEKLTARCKAAQVITANVTNRVEKVAETRVNKYNQLTSKLQSLSGRVAANGVDTTNLDAEIQEAQVLIDDFVALMEDHKMAIEDTSQIDCQADPSGFKLALEDARAQRKELKTAATAIKDQIKNGVKTELQNIRALLEAGRASDEKPQQTEPTDEVPATDPDTPVSSDGEAN